MKKIFALLLAALSVSSAMLLTSCSTTEENSATVSLKNATEIVLNGDTATCDSQAVYVGEDGKITITAAGTYSITGTLNNGQIYVDCIDAGQLDLVLNGANITNDDGPCIVIWKAQDAIVTLYDGSVNTLTDGSKYRFENPADDEPDAALFSKEDLTINGNGKLVVDANYSGGIFSKDGLKIDNGDIEIDSVNHAIKGKDYLVVNNGTIRINALGDGIKSTNYENDLVGYVEINGGTLDIYTEDEAVQAVSAVKINGGTLSINSVNNGIKCAAGIEFNGGTVDLNAADAALDAMSIDKADACTVNINGTPYNG